MGYDGGRDGFVDGTVEANNAFLLFLFFNVNKILSQQAREGGMGARWGKKGFAGREASFCATLIEDEVVGVLCVVYH